jgi:hypothetical protein
MAGAGPWTLYNDFKLNALKKLMDLSADSMKVALVTSSSNAIVATLTPGTYATITNELTTANGYTAGGVACGSDSLTGGGATATITWDIADATWTASGAGFTARAAVLYDDTAASKNLIAFMLLDSTPADVTVAAGNTLTIQIANVFTLT